MTEVMDRIGVGVPPPRKETIFVCILGVAIGVGTAASAALDAEGDGAASLRQVNLPPLENNKILQI